jgi:HK97 gp10 family phage protein
MARETVRIEGLDTVLRRLRALGPAASKRGGPVRAAVRKGAVVIQKAAQANVRRIVAAPNIGGHDVSTGTLEKAIKPVRAKAPQKYKGETYFVTVSKRARYPISKRTPSGIDAATVGKMLEYGTSKRKPMPWMRPAFHAKKEEAAQVMATEVEKGIAKLEAKVAAEVR